MTPTETLERISRSGQAVFAIDSADRIILWNKKCEDLLGKSRPNSEIDKLFLLTVVMASLVWAIAIPFFLVEPTSLPLSVGILAGLMWVPFSWMIRHWIGLFHGIARTVLIVVAWYLFPDHRFVAIPIVIVAVYLVSIVVLIRRRPG